MRIDVDPEATDYIVEAAHNAVIAAMQAAAANELTIVQLQNLRADAHALAGWTDDKIAEWGGDRM